MQIDLTRIIVAVIGLLSSIITRYAVPYFISKTSTEKRKEISYWIKLAVEAAETIFKESGMGACKKEYVKKFLEAKGYVLNDLEINIAIESAVLEMKNAIEHNQDDGESK